MSNSVNNSIDSTSDTCKQRINISITGDAMFAFVEYNLSEDELDISNRMKLINETISKLKEKGVVSGIKTDLFQNKLEPNIPYIIAEGIAPEAGRDAEIKMFELKEAKPEAIEDKKLDYYNLSLITTVDANSWLGEKEEATEGTDGRTVRGETLKAKKGIDFPLYYDRETVYEVNAGGKTILYSKEYGAVYYKGRDIATMNPLIISGDVDFNTGNVIFDGCVIIHGTICDGFYVEAENDIEVNGELGLGNIKAIISRKGSIFVKGGILSKSGSKLEAAQNIYVKFVENVSLTCGGTAHIGFYSSNSIIRAKEVVVDSLNGKILGGSIQALTRVVSPVIGSDIGKRVVIEVTGFNRAAIKRDYEILEKKIGDLKNDYENLKQKISSYSSKPSLTTIQERILYDSKREIIDIRNELKKLSVEKDEYNCYLKARGDGEICATKVIYPKTFISIKKNNIEISELKYSVTFTSQGGKMIEF